VVTATGRNINGLQGAVIQAVVNQKGGKITSPKKHFEIKPGGKLDLSRQNPTEQQRGTMKIGRTDTVGFTHHEQPKQTTT